MSPRGTPQDAGWPVREGPASGAVSLVCPPSVPPAAHSAANVRPAAHSRLGFWLVPVDEIPWLQARLHELGSARLDVGSCADHVGQDVADLEMHPHPPQLIGALDAV